MGKQKVYVLMDRMNAGYLYGVFSSREKALDFLASERPYDTEDDIVIWEEEVE